MLDRRTRSADRRAALAELLDVCAEVGRVIAEDELVHVEGCRAVMDDKVDEVREREDDISRAQLRCGGWRRTVAV